MKRTAYIMAVATALSMVALAGDWSGKLIDSTCNDTKEQTKVDHCNATTATTSFAIDVAGKIYKLDATGNTKAAAALKARADRSTDPAKALSSPYTAKVMGTEKGGVIEVETVDID